MEDLGKLFRVLVVEDEAPLRSLISRAFRALNMRVDEVEDGIAAQNSVRAHRYDAVISDLRMPRMNGHRLAIELLGLPNPPMVIVVTSVAEQKIVWDLLTRGVADIVLKPVDCEFLATKVHALLQRQAPAGKLAGGPSADSMIKDITKATSVLRSELESVSATFQLHISELESKKKELEEGFVGSLRVLASLIEQVGQAGDSHASRVAAMATWIARDMKMSGDALRDLEAAALLHDIGQFGMPDTVRQKAPWTLTSEERSIYERYPSLGAILLSEIPTASGIVELVENHAERIDGRGFPERKQGTQIPIGSQIIGICDATDTYMMHAKPDEAVKLVHEYLREQARMSFDPDHVMRVQRYLIDQKPSRVPDLTETIGVPALQLAPDQVIAEDVFDEYGRFLLRVGTRVTKTNVAHLSYLLRDRKVKVFVPRTKA